ncbi:MAG TPA: hypothetical protein VFN51_02400 [Candidatus Saccharimonadales bacterium]|nr:hypothetical protein [Candidatus Saccharimonadales bacterium]
MKNHNFPPEAFNSGYDVVPPVFRLGNNERNHERVEGGRRILTWMVQPEDIELAAAAGWDRFKVTYHEGEGSLEIPTGTRNGRSVLSGVEAWRGEKSSLVKTVTDYIKILHDRYEAYDTKLSWGQVGVTPMHEVFVAPPNSPHTSNNEKVAAWKRTMASELAIILRNDEENKDLPVNFENEIDRILQNAG